MQYLIIFSVLSTEGDNLCKYFHNNKKHWFTKSTNASHYPNGVICVVVETLVIQAQSGSEDALLELIIKFKPLLKKYAYKLKYEDAYFDLQADFIQLILMLETEKIKNRSEGGFVNYICYAMKNYYIARSKNTRKHQRESVFSDLSEGEINYIESILSEKDNYFRAEMTSMWSCLTKNEREIIILHYMEGVSIERISTFRNISRQAVNKMKLSALRKLKTSFK